MAESMVGLKRSHRCTEVSSADIGKKVTVMGWVAKRRTIAKNAASSTPTVRFFIAFSFQIHDCVTS